MADKNERTIVPPALTLIRVGQNVSKVRIRPRTLILLIIIFVFLIALLDLFYYNL